MKYSNKKREAAMRVFVWVMLAIMLGGVIFSALLMLL